MSIPSREVRRVLKAARGLSLTAPSETVEDFVSRVLSLNPFQRGLYFPDPDPNGLLAEVVGRFTTARKEILQEECYVPTFAIYEDALGAYRIAGLNTYLESKKVSAALRAKLSQHSRVRAALRRLQKGQYLEAVAAAIMNEGGDNYGVATQGSGDQGIDAIGWRQLMVIQPAFCDGSLARPGDLPGERVFLFASSKAIMNETPKGIPILQPTHIREVAGGWVIQRTSTGIWQKVGIRMLSPVQMILVTTYRLSDASKAECRELGIQVWGLPELIYLVCLTAPSAVFDSSNGYAFSALGFGAWWKTHHRNRMMASDI